MSPAFAYAYVVLFIGAWIVPMASIVSIGGHPTVKSGQYFLDDHGSLIPVTRAEYDHALVLQQYISPSSPVTSSSTPRSCTTPSGGDKTQTDASRTRADFSAITVCKSEVLGCAGAGCDGDDLRGRSDVAGDVAAGGADTGR